MRIPLRLRWLVDPGVPGVGSSLPESDYNVAMGVTASSVLQETHWALAPLIGAVALAVNLPLGYARAGFRKFSLGWFVCVHLSVPLIAWLRLSNHVSAWGIPAFLACAVLGQFAGGKARRIRRERT